MKVITLWQPWASLVALGHKKLETRGYNTKVRGPVLIHAAAAKRQLQALSDEMHQELIKLNINPYELPHGAIVGVVNITDSFQFNDQPIIQIGELMEQFNAWLEPAGANDQISREMVFGDYSPGRFGWLLENPEAFKNPIPTKGSQGWWNYDGPLPELS